MKEIWKDIPEFKGYYKISNLGRVKRIKKYGNTYCGRILKERKDQHGYIEYKLMKNGKYYFRKAHRLVGIVFIPNPNNLETINHKNGIKIDNRIENLEWMSREDNAKHSMFVLKNNPPKKVKCVENGKIYDSVSAAAKNINRRQGNISRAIKDGGSSGGFHWEFV